MQTVTPGAPRTEIVRRGADFDALAEEWGRLYADSPTATPFQTHAWLASWARSYARHDALRVVLVRQAGRLVLAAPLHVVRRGPVRVLAPLGGAITDTVDLLVDRALEPEAAQALTDALLDEPGWQVVDLPELPTDSVASTWASSWPGPVSTSTASTCLELPVEPLPDLLARLPGRTAGTLRRKLRRAAALGLHVESVGSGEVADAVADLVRLHEEQWRGRRGNPEHLALRFRSHLAGALPEMVARGQAQVTGYRLAGELVAAQVLLLGHHTLGYYLAGVSPSLREQVDVSSLLLTHDLEVAAQAGLSRYSMLRGSEDYKSRWRPEVVQQHRLVLLRPRSVLARGYAVGVRMRGRAIATAKERAPGLRVWRDRALALRGRLASRAGR